MVGDFAWLLTARLMWSGKLNGHAPKIFKYNHIQVKVIQLTQVFIPVHWRIYLSLLHMNGTQPVTEFGRFTEASW